MEVQRRRLNTYSRTTKKTLVHDLFDVTAKQPNPFRPETLDSLPPSRTRTPISDVSEDPEPSKQLRREMLLATNLRSSQVSSSRSTSPSSAHPASPAVFEIESSDDELSRNKPARAVYKRRKLAPGKTEVEQQLARTEMLTAKRKGAAKRQVKTGRSSPSGAEGEEGVRQTSNSTATSTSPDIHKTPPSIGSPLSDKSTTSMMSTRSTPKRKRQTVEDVLSDVSSPSQLELSALSLSPHRRNRGKTKAKAIDSEQSNVSMSTP